MSKEEKLCVPLEDAFGTSFHIPWLTPDFSCSCCEQFPESWDSRPSASILLFSSAWQPSLRPQESILLELQPRNTGIIPLGVTFKQERQELVDKNMYQPLSFRWTILRDILRPLSCPGIFLNNLPWLRPFFLPCLSLPDFSFLLPATTS